MIVVVEGIDRVGKTTLVKKLEKVGFVNLKDEFSIDSLITSFSDYSVGKCESFVKAAQALESQGKNVVIDRLHLTEFAYGIVNRGGTNQSAIWAVDMLLANLGAVLCYIRPTDIQLSNEKAGVDQTELYEHFEFAIKVTSMRTMVHNFYTLDEAVNSIMYLAKRYDFYFASPFFTPEQIEREERMIQHLRNLGYAVFSPKENCHLDSKASQKSRMDVFKSNCDAIRQSRAVFAITDGKDMGTIWGAGFAYGIGAPIIYFAETLGDNQFNLMLAQSGMCVFTNQDSVSKVSLNNAMHGNATSFEGEIE